MLKKLSSGSGRTFVCPHCGAGLCGKPKGRAQVLTCVACGTKASVAEWTQWPIEHTMDGRADQPPAGTRIRRENVADSIAWHIPAHGKFGSSLFFGLFWCFVTAVLSGAFLVGFLTNGKAREEMPIWLLIPFFGVFWTIGLAMLYGSARRKWMTHRLTVGSDEVVMRQEMFGRSKERSLPISEIRSIEQKEFYQQNNRSMYGIEIKGTRGKLRFSSALDASEKAWLVADLREVIFGPPKPVRAVVPEPRPVLNHLGTFSVEIPHARKHLWPLAIVSVLMGAVFLVFSMTLLKEPWEMGNKEDPLMVRVFDGIFNVVGHSMQAVIFLLGLVFVIGGSVFIVHFIRSRGSVKKLEGNSLEIAIRTYRHNLVWKEKAYPRSQITDIRASESGSSGTTVMKRIELIVGDEVVNVASWIDGDAADALVAQVRSCL